MNIKTQIGFVGFLLAVSTLSVADAYATNQLSQSESDISSIENRISRISKAIRDRNIKDLETSPHQAIPDMISGFANRRYGGGFVNRAGGGGFVNRAGGGGFINNRWGDGGSFYNRRY